MYQAMNNKKLLVITKPNQEAFQGINLFNGGIGGLACTRSWWCW
jgi:hypothetical protein